jgi:hypothetical protein
MLANTTITRACSIAGFTLACLVVSVNAQAATYNCTAIFSDGGLITTVRADSEAEAIAMVRVDVPKALSVTCNTATPGNLIPLN